MVKALYVFSGDPITYGHIDIVDRASKLFDELVVGIGINPKKQYLFTLDEREEMAKRALAKFPNVKVTAYSGLTVNFAYKHNIPVLVKGIRNSVDAEYERGLFAAGETQNLGIDSVVLFARKSMGEISSSLVKELQSNNGQINELVPLYVKQCLEAKISEQYIVGVTGEIHTGKNYVSDKLVDIGREKGINVHNIDLDKIGHKILGEWTDEVYVSTREEIEKQFGPSVRNPDGTIDRKVLGEKVFNDRSKMDTLNRIMEQPLKSGLEDELKGKKGIILYNAALIAEANLGHICNNNVVLVTANKASQERRMKGKGLTDDQIRKRLESQYTAEQKREYINQAITKTGSGKLFEYDNSDGKDDSGIEKLFDDIVKELKVK